MKRLMTTFWISSLVVAGVVCVLSAAEPSEPSCDCGGVASTPQAGGELLAQAAAQPNDAPPSGDAQPSNDAAPLRAAAQPVYEAQPFGIAGQQYASRQVFIGQGRRCGTPTPTADEIEIERNAVAAARRVEGAERLLSRQSAAKVKIVFHVIHKGNEGKVTQGQIEKQVEVLNKAYMGSNFTFELDDVTFTDVAADPTKASWFTMRHTDPPHSSEMDAKEALRRDTDTTLNIYTANLNGGLLGWATFPSDLAQDPDDLGFDPTIRDGCVILYTSLPQADGSPNPSGGPYGEGQTLTHEAGHYLGLYHTFQGGCLPPGDEVVDTPAHQTNFGCPEADAIPDTCLGDDKKDPVHNFMNYTDDKCMNEFSPLQVARIHEQCGVFRPKFFDVTEPLRNEIEAAARAAAR